MLHWYLIFKYGAECTEPLFDIQIQSPSLARTLNLPFLPFPALWSKGWRRVWEILLFRWFGGPSQPLGVGTERYWQHATACRCQIYHTFYGREAWKEDANMRLLSTIVFLFCLFVILIYKRLWLRYSFIYLSFRLKILGLAT